MAEHEGQRQASKPIVLYSLLAGRLDFLCLYEVFGAKSRINPLPAYMSKMCACPSSARSYSRLPPLLTFLCILYLQLDGSWAIKQHIYRKSTLNFHGLDVPCQEIWSVVNILYIKKYYLILAFVLHVSQNNILSRQAMWTMWVFLFCFKEIYCKDWWMNSPWFCTKTVSLCWRWQTGQLLLFSLFTIQLC